MLENAPDNSIEPATMYEAPAITSLGTLIELTLGGSDVLFDGTGGAGDGGSL